MDLKIISTRKEIKEFFGEEPIMAATIRVTKACNLKCPHCYVNAGKKLKDELSLEEIKSVIDQLASLKVFSIFFTGGEPFLRKDIVEILKYTDKKGIGIAISTNASVLNKEILEKIKDLRFDLFQISIDGPKKIHESIKGEDSWRRTINSIKLAKSILKKKIGLGIVIMKNNWKFLDKTIIKGVNCGADRITLMCLLLSGRANESFSPSPKEFLHSVNKIFDRYAVLQSKAKFAKDTTIPSALIPKKWREKGLHKTFAPCSFPYYIAINSNGDVGPCDGLFNYPEMIIGNIRKNSLSEIWQKSKLLRELRKINPSDLKGVCSKCIYREYCVGGCRAAAYINYHNFRMPDPICQTMYEAGLFPKDCLKS
jgi:radical SAM protein with 4Fe4S-binding SPASM domain